MKTRSTRIESGHQGAPDRQRRRVLQAAACGLGALVLPVWAQERGAEEGFALGGDVASMDAASVARLASLTDKVESWTAQNTITITGKSSTTRIRKGWMANQLRDSGDNALRYFRFSEPADLSGTALLIHENNPAQDDLWLFLPAVGRSRRIVSSSLKNSFIGTEFAFADLMTQQAERFQHQFVKDAETLAETACWVIDSAAKEPSWAEDIGYARQRAWVRQSDYATLRVDYYNLQDELFKRQLLSEFQLAEGRSDRFIARQRQMTNLENERETIMRFDEVVMNTAVDAGYFRPERLGRG